MSSRGARQTGFTLIEVLVAFVILVMALPVLYGIFSNGLRSVSLSEDYRTAVALAESRLAEIGVSEPLLDGDTRSSDDGRYTWLITSEEYSPWEDDGTAPQLPVRAYRVVLDISWFTDGNQRSLSLTTIKLVNSSGLPG